MIDRKTMKKFFSMLFIATMFGLVFTACGDDEPAQTAAPEITFEILADQAVVTAKGQGEVSLYIDGKSTTNPTILQRIHQDYVAVFTATAKEANKRISEVTTLELTIPKNDKLVRFAVNSEYESETDAHFMFDIDLDKDSSSIYMYNIVFRIGEATSPAMTLRVNAPVTVDKDGKIYTYSGTGIVPDLMRGTIWVPMTGDAYMVHNLTCTVNPEAKDYYITFDCHGGHFEQTGKLK